MVLAAEVGGRWSEEARAFVNQLAKAEARSVPRVLAGRARQAWKHRWASLSWRVRMLARLLCPCSTSALLLVPTESATCHPRSPERQQLACVFSQTVPVTVLQFLRKKNIHCCHVSCEFRSHLKVGTAVTIRPETDSNDFGCEFDFRRRGFFLNDSNF